jgi:hypothetical protein
MSKKQHTLVRRAAAVQKLMDQYTDKAFKIGSNDCVKLARTHLVNMGHKVPSTGHYSDVKGAIAALKKQDVKNVAELLDKFLERIPPASMLPGDVALPPSEPEAPASKLGTVVVKVAGGNKYLGWHPDVEYLAVMTIQEVEAAWRV